MTFLSRSTTQGLILTLLALFFSSCSTVNNVTVIPESSPEEQLGNSVVETNDDFLELIEPKVCLEEELKALSQTGGWDETPIVGKGGAEEKVEFDFPLVMNKKVQTYLDLFQNRQKVYFGRWLARSTIYRSMMEKELEKGGLPKDLAYLAMIESGFSPLACSRAKAVGLWQFMKATGRQYDLKVDRYVDERRDPLKSTKAAVTYLSDLYQEFGDWHLAIAAYNAGPGTIRNGLRKYKVNNFWDLAKKRYLRVETKRYVPKLIAALMIAKEPEKYGFSELSYYEPLGYDTLTVGPGMSLDAIALISGSKTKVIRGLNHELLRGKTPLNRRHYSVKIPKATKELAASNLPRLHSLVSTGYKTHKVRRGDTLSKISRRYHVNKTTILKVNNLHSPKLASGRNLRIPYSTIRYQLLPKGTSKAVAAFKDNLILHRVKPGETISRISKKYNVPPATIVGWNGLKNIHSIRAGQQLALYIDNGSRQRPTTRKSQVAVLQPGKSKRKLNHADGEYEWYRVKSGDSLWTISRKFSASTADIKKWNNLKSNLIHPGSQLKLKKV